MVVYESIELDVSVEKAWNFLIDEKNWVEWWAKINKAKWLYPFRLFPGYVKYENGSESKVIGFIFDASYKSYITLESKFTVTSFKLIYSSYTGLKFEIAQETKGVAFYSDGEKTILKIINEALVKFKSCVEKE